jgi:CheY-like chemotaxis protein
MQVMSILIVDTNPEILSSMAYALGKLGFNVLTERHPECALDRLGKENPAALITAKGMKDSMSGEFLIALARSQGYRGTAILVTAAAEPIVPAGANWAFHKEDIDGIAAALRQVQVEWA